jgi:hypothetical protein
MSTYADKLPCSRNKRMVALLIASALFMILSILIFAGIIVVFVVASKRGVQKRKFRFRLNKAEAGSPGTILGIRGDRVR